MDQHGRDQQATYPLPMNPYNFQLAKEAAYQQVELQPDMVREEMRHERAMEREVLKSHNRQLEVLQKQMAKEKTNRINYYKNSVNLTIVNGTNVIIADKILFHCRILQLKCYQFDNTDLCYWQIILAEQGGQTEVVSQLYDENLLTSPNKLKGTILSKYICVNDNKIDALAWNWMFTQLNTLYEDADIIELPFKPGWFHNENGWHFWTNSDDSFLLSNLIEKFSIDRFECLQSKEVIKKLLSYSMRKASCQQQLAILLIFRLTALMGRFTGDEQFCPSLTIIGENANQVAQKYLRTMKNNVDTTNIDSDRITNIRNRVKSLQDTPAIFLSSDPDSKSTQNRMRDIRSWMDNGLVEGTKIDVPFVFCLGNFSKEYHLNNTIILECSAIEASEVPLWYDQIQSLLISMIEDSGNFWANEFKNEYDKNQGRFAIFKTITKLVPRMLESYLEDATNTEFKNFLHLGIEEIERQFSLEYGVLLDIFRENVLQLVDEGILSVVSRNQCPLSFNTLCIYYDTEFYFFCQEEFQEVCLRAKIDLKSILSLKQQLIEQGFVRIYKNSGYRNRELEVNFVVNTFNGQNIGCLA